VGIGFRSVVACALVLGVAGTAHPCDQRTRGPFPIRVVVHDAIGVPPAVARQARTTVGKIIAHVDVEPVWIDVDTTMRWGDATAEAVRTRAFLKSLYAVRLVQESHRLRRNEPSTRALGFAAPGTQVATIHYGRVIESAGGESHRRGLILGHVIAHELGHLLLGQTSHSATGLMLARLDVPLAGQGRLLFTEEQGEVIRGAVSPCAALP
jgi:hypothetical protein